MKNNFSLLTNFLLKGIFTSYSLLFNKLFNIHLIMAEALIGNKKSPLSSSLSDFEAVSPQKFYEFALQHRVPDGFLFVVGVSKYKNGKFFFRCGKDKLFMQSFLPHQQENIFKTRDYGQIFSMYEPENKQSDDVVLTESAVYHRKGDRFVLILGDKECRDRKSVAKMFEYIICEKQLLDFAPENTLPGIYEVTFKKKSCGYFLKDRTYQVFATPVGIPNAHSGEITKGWLFCDINCGAPAVMPLDREELVALDCSEGSKVSIFTIRDNVLVYEG